MLWICATSPETDNKTLHNALHKTGMYIMEWQTVSSVSCYLYAILLVVYGQ